MSSKYNYSETYNTWWVFLHYMSVKYSRSQNFKKFVFGLLTHLPCISCMRHSKHFVRKYKNINNTEMLFQLHNDVNKRIGKPVMDWNTFTQKYKHLHGPKDELRLKLRFVDVLKHTSRIPRDLQRFVNVIKIL